ncbi:MAG TPA: L-rhamnose isomerase [Lentisphaeria bacterium]|nr:MAG: L-rhamnose isomerase [Lentisphaerae bacterium GWF2_49_21]HBC86596.1 L-rhamnose isomerase [Lentisphaeria bacterium]
MIGSRYNEAKEIYASLGVDTEKAMKTLSSVKISMHCWQGDDVGGFEVNETGLTGGIMATGNYPGRARNADELRKDAEKAFSMIPGKQRFNLHAIYLESDNKFIDRDKVSARHFSRWIEWAKEQGIGLDFNPTFFSHPKSSSGMTLSNPDKAIRKFWIEHGIRSREIASEFSGKLNGRTVNNLWIPDGMKDIPADRSGPRQRLLESLDEIYKSKVAGDVKDAVEGKLFGIGSEEYVVGSNEFYLAYSITRKKLVCMDMGHYHPTETIHDKLSAVLPFAPELLIHVSRPIRWDSDHVVIMNDDLVNLAKEIIRCDALGRVYLATDFFDASINRIGAWVIGVRSLQKALLIALLEPSGTLRKLELAGRNAEKLALSEELRALPFGDVWNFYCESKSVPAGASWIGELEKYEKDVLSKRK